MLGRVARPIILTTHTGTRARCHQDTQMDHYELQRHERAESAGGAAVGGTGRKGTAVSVLISDGIQALHGCKGR